MGANNQPNKNTAQALDKKAIQGVDKYLAKVKIVTVAGANYTPDELKAVLQDEIDAIEALDEVQAQMQQQVADTRAAKAKASVTRAGLRAHILGNYGAVAVQMLVDFGMSVPKAKGKKTAQVKADAVTKALATREARHTMGKKQKLAIKGVTQTAAQAETPTQSAQAAKPAQVAAAAATTLPN